MSTPIGNSHITIVIRFLPFCTINIKAELESGASSIRTTSSSRPLASDATLHWSKWIFLACGVCAEMTLI
jgi:hypothetical protein